MKKETAATSTIQRIDSAWGTFEAIFSSRGLAGIRFPHQAAATPLAAEPANHRLARLTKAALVSILQGKTPTELPPLDLQGTEFQKAVWNTLASIPPGQTMTYGDIAKAIGRPRAFRAVGQACGANPLPVVIPCHRALAADKKIGGFSGGLEWKEKLLSVEGCSFRKTSLPKVASVSHRH